MWSGIGVMSVSQLMSQNKANCSLSAFDKENSMEFSLDSVHYLYMKSNPNPSLLSHAALWVTFLSHIH